jgi:hypothetical protein
MTYTEFQSDAGKGLRAGIVSDKAAFAEHNLFMVKKANAVWRDCGRKACLISG